MSNKYVSNGRFAAIFFASFSCISAVAADEIYWQLDSAINRGLLADNYWQSQTMKQSSPKVLAYLDSQIGVSTDVAGQKIFVERRKISTLSTNTNSLLAASNPERSLEGQSYGVFPLKASLQKYEFDAVGLVFEGAIARQLTWSVSPKALRLNSVSTGEGQGELVVTPNSQHLSGNLTRHGMSSYGFTSDPQSTQVGLGGSLDGQLRWKSPAVQVDLDAINLVSRIPASGLFYNQRSYQVSTQSGDLVFNNIPSLTGTYGQMDPTLKLPRIIKSTLRHQEMQSNWSQSVGVINFQGSSIPWGGIGYKRGDASIQAKTYVLNNLFISYEQSHFLVSNLVFELTLGTAFQGKPQVALTTLKYVF
jgi:hypothetical protein